ncbi:fimbrial protein [Atlantibacter subterranea]|uniref:Fimbrial protein n=1 Tax=Atlantibacter subterraneus TaxID=255519 RepID=A0ABU4DW96_9ENTR|nr:fimbrial protein [Atlantibacter subterranea]MDV7021138.1 fimbrial protein [Atlantibacter subterranea]MDZ5664764.1 fimbrial protein [Atlantibacter hermannii]
MKLASLASAFAAVLALSSASAFAIDGTVNFTGEILDAACTVDIGTNNTMSVDLGKVVKTTFAATGDTASTTKFTIKLKDCPAAVTSAKVKFEGTPDATDSTLLGVTGTATGVAIQLMTADKTALGLHQVNNYSYPLTATVVNNLDFYAAYKSTAATVSAGTANAVSNFTVNYN